MESGLAVRANKEIKLCAKLNSYLNTAAAAAKSFHSCPTLCDPIDGSPPGSPGPGILQARILEWVATAFSKISPRYLLFIIDPIFANIILYT